MGEKQEKWSLVCEPLDYLDGIQSGLTVKRENGAPVAYMFNHKEAVLAASAPELLAALQGCIPQLELGNGEAEHIKAAYAALTKATGKSPDAQ